MAFRQFYPCEYVQSVFDIDYEKLFDLGYKGLIFDVDNTLVHHGDPSTEEVDDLLRSLLARGFKIVLLSDNNAERLDEFTANVPLPYIDEAGKPDPKGYDAAIEKLGLAKNEVIVIGDQMFTDIRGANAAGLDSILVHFIMLPGETRIGKRRYAEKVLRAFWRLDKRRYRRLGGIEKASIAIQGKSASR